MALHTLVQKKRRIESLTEPIERQLRRSENAVAPMAVGDWLRVSSVGGICPREEVLCARAGVVRPDAITADLGMVFEMGHGIHWVMQNRVLAGTRQFVGSWRCTWCGETYGSMADGLLPRPQRCDRCGAVAGDEPRESGRPIGGVRAGAFLYVEQWVEDARYCIGGHPDGFWWDGIGGDYSIEDLVLLEFKSASDRAFVKYREVPDFMHVIQCQAYMWLTGTRRAKIIYVNKAKYGVEAIREHDLEYDAGTVKRVQSAIAEIRSGIDGGPIPPRVFCGSESCARAVSCEVSSLCFGEKYD